MAGPEIDPRRRRVAFAAGVALVAACLGATVQAGPALAAGIVLPPLAQYTAAVTPATVPVGSTATVNVTISEVAGSLGTIGAATVKLPSTFTAVSVPATVTSSAGRPWTVAFAAGTLKVRTAGLFGIGSLVPGRSVTVPITFRPTATGAFSLATTASITALDLIPFFTLKGSAPTVQVQAGGTLCAAGQSCSTPGNSLTGTSGTSAQTDVYTITADPGSTPTVITATVTYPGADHRLLCQSVGVDQVLTFDVPGRSKTIFDHRNYNVNAGVCFGSDLPFKVIAGNSSADAPFNPANGEYEADLPMCNELSDVGIPATNPCIASTFFNDDGTVDITVRAPVGDPKFTN